MRVQECGARKTAEKITHRDAAHIARARGNHGGDERELALPDERPRECEQRFVWNRKTNDAQREQRKQRDRPVVGNPAEQLLFHTGILSLRALRSLPVYHGSVRFVYFLPISVASLLAGPTR